MHAVSVLVLAIVPLCLLPADDAFLVDDDEGGDETLRDAMQAIRQLDSRLSQVAQENDRLKQRLDEAEKIISSHSESCCDAPKSRLQSDFVWFGDWVLAFRATAGINIPVYDTWVNTGHHDDDPETRVTVPCACTTVNGSLPCDRHYRSRLLDAWPSASIDQVRLVLYENGEEMEHMTFTGTGTDRDSWFTPSRLVDSSWTDLRGNSDFVYFSIVGNREVFRRFEVMHNYGGCPNDVGWLTVKDKRAPTGECPWDTPQTLPAFLYAPGHAQIQWSSNGFREADVMAVFVKFLPNADLNQMCLA